MVPAAGPWCQGVTETLHRDHEFPMPGQGSHNPKLIWGKLPVPLSTFINLLLVKRIKSVVTHFSKVWRPSKQKKNPFAGPPQESSGRREGAGWQGVHLMQGMLGHPDLVGSLLLKRCGFLA